MASSESSAILHAEEHSWSYWFFDGLPNLMAGILCLLLSGTFILVFRYRHTHNWIVFAAVAAGLGAFMVLWLRLRQTLEWLKARTTYRRTGYVPSPYFTETDAAAPADLVMLNLSGVREEETRRPLLVSEDLRWRLWVALPILIAEPLAGRFISNHTLCVLTGCAGGVLTWLVSRRDPRKAWAVVLGLLMAQVFTVDLGSSLVVEGAFYFLAGVGFVLALVGAIVLTRYLKRNPVARA